MKRYFGQTVETLALAIIAVLNLYTICLAGPPGPPTIPSTPVGNAEVSMATIVVVAAYGYWKSRK